MLYVSALISLELQCGIIRVVPNLWYDSFRWLVICPFSRTAIVLLEAEEFAFGHTMLLVFGNFFFRNTSTSFCRQSNSSLKQRNHILEWCESLTHMFFYIWKCIKEGNRESSSKVLGSLNRIVGNYQIPLVQISWKDEREIQN